MERHTCDTPLAAPAGPERVEGRLRRPRKPRLTGGGGAASLRGVTRLAPGPLTDWKTRAECTGYPNAIFFPGPDAPERVIERATAVCSVCPVADDCLQYAFEANQRSGIWGGTTEQQRKSLRRKWLAERRLSA